MALQEGKIFILLHGLCWAKLYDGGSHLSHGLGKIFFYYIYVQLTHMISHASQNIFPCTFLNLLLIMNSFSDMDLICIRGMIMRVRHELDVSLRGENSHIFCTTCSNGSMRGAMATTATCLFSFEVGHEIDIHPLYNHGKVFYHVLMTYSAIYYSLVDEMVFVH